MFGLAQRLRAVRMLSTPVYQLAPAYQIARVNPFAPRAVRMLSAPANPFAQGDGPEAPSEQQKVDAHIAEQQLKQTGSAQVRRRAQAGLTLERMLAAGMHIGHATGLWHPMNLPHIFGRRQGIHVINLEHTLAALRRAAQFARQVAYRGGLIVFAGTRKAHQQIAVDAALAADQYFVTGRWAAGAISNRAKHQGRHFTYADDLWDVAEAQALAEQEAGAREEARMQGAGSNRYLRQIEEEKRQLQSQHVGAAYSPDLIVALNPMEAPTMLREARRGLVPTIGVVDTNCDPRCVTYAVPCNDDSAKAVALVAHVLSRAAREGMELRRRRLVRAAESHVQRVVDKEHAQELLDQLSAAHKPE
ncbi:hypothetical protein H4R23_001086 [Coemansia sp. Cherry 401B]|nr:hypothetical protein H4S01_000483 [Coemansia sp. RSA 2610]KAJ2738522.1 hypothetical protein H4R23_001086 [Coemansia sp. Cherry 401B]